MSKEEEESYDSNDNINYTDNLDPGHHCIPDLCDGCLLRSATHQPKQGSSSPWSHNRRFHGYGRTHLLLVSSTAPGLISMQARGTIKWFNSRKKYGFVILDQDGGEAMIHLSCIRPFNLQQVPKGSVGEFIVEKNERGLAVKKVISLKLPESFVNGKNYIPATVKWFDTNRGYGFLTRGVGTPDIFLHATTLKESTLAELDTDQEVLVVVEESDKGPKVVYIKAAPVRPLS